MTDQQAGAPARYTLLASLWTTQFVGVAFLTIGLTGILRAGGTSLETLALVQLLALIWPLKFLWAPWIDRYGSRRQGHHRSWLLAAQTGMTLALLALLPFDDPSAWIGPVAAAGAVFVFFAATQDTATDALAVRLLAPAERGLGNGLQVGGGYAGTVLGGGACVVVYDRWGWVPAIALLAALTASALVVIARFTEPARPVTDRRASLRTLASVLRQPGCHTWTFVVVPLVYVPAAGANALFSPALLDVGWSLSTVGTVTGVVASVPALIAALLAGLALRRFSLGAVLLVGAVGMGGAAAGLLPLMAGADRPGVTVAALCVFAAAFAVANVAVYTRFMQFARPGTEGTDVTVLTSISMIVSIVAGSAALGAAQAFGYRDVTLACTALALLAGLVGLRNARSLHEGSPHEGLPYAPADSGATTTATTAPAAVPTASGGARSRR